MTAPESCGCKTFEPSTDKWVDAADRGASACKYPATVERLKVAEEALNAICEKRASGRSPCGCYAMEDPDWHNFECQVYIAREALGRMGTNENR